MNDGKCLREISSFGPVGSLIRYGLHFIFISHLQRCPFHQPASIIGLCDFLMAPVKQLQIHFTHFAVARTVTDDTESSRPTSI